jgi:hypothetical protein
LSLQFAVTGSVGCLICFLIGGLLLRVPLLQRV